ncbi:MAG TPA: hypothetical protein PKI11_04875 [Candidatus Hydrogenedentes bacterium]|nr:hypothetical protein [Candidatus Hydrogenedentota bacterium]HNT88132.1 hypothetical protein [Candidatus Hydrogenedentota bacterium]
MAALRFLTLSILPVALLQACGNKPVTPPPPAPPVEDVVVAPREMDIGDAESAIAIEGRLAPGSAPNVTVDNLEGRNKVVVMSTITVRPPAPAELWIEYTVSSTIGFPSRPVALRCTAMRAIGEEETPLARFGTVLGKDAHLPETMAQPGGPPRSFRVNALEGLDEPPESMLLHTTGELLLLPPGTDVDAVDAETAAALPNDTSSAIQTNPVRVVFEGAAENTLTLPLSQGEREWGWRPRVARGRAGGSVGRPATTKPLTLPLTQGERDELSS